MLQGQRYWPDFCRAVGRPDLVLDPRFDTDENRAANIADCIGAVDVGFGAKPLGEGKTILGTQPGLWDVVQKVGRLTRDPQAIANRFFQDVDYGDGRSLKMVSTPLQFDREALPARPAPDHGAHSDEVLGELGLTEQEIIDLKVAGVVY